MSIDAMIFMDERFKDREYVTFSEVITDNEINNDDATIYLNGNWIVHDLIVEAVGVEAFKKGSLKITPKVFKKIESIYQRWVNHRREESFLNDGTDSLRDFINEVNEKGNVTRNMVLNGACWYVCDREEVYLDSCFDVESCDEDWEDEIGEECVEVREGGPMTGQCENTRDSLTKDEVKTKIIPLNYHLGDRISPYAELYITARVFSDYMNGAFKEQEPVSIYVTNAVEELEDIKPTERVGYVKQFSIDGNGQVVAEVVMENEDLYREVICGRKISSIFEFDFQRRLGLLVNIKKISSILIMPSLDRHYVVLKKIIDSIAVKDLRYIKYEDVISTTLKNCIDDIVLLNRR